MDEPMPADEPLSPAERLRARAVVTDRAARFEQRLEHVEQQRTRRRALRRVIRVVWAMTFATLGAIAPLVVAAVTGGADPSGTVILTAAVAGGVLGAIGPTLRERIARRRGPTAWDAYHERHVLLGDPSADVRDADRPRGGPGLPPPPGR